MKLKTISEADKAQTSEFKNLINTWAQNNTSYNGKSFLGDSIGFTIKGLHRIEEDGNTRDLIQFQYKTPTSSFEMWVPVTEEIIQYTLADPNNAGQIFSTALTAWGAVNSYSRWLDSGRETPMPHWTTDNTPVKDATPEQLRELDEYIKKNNEEMALVGGFLMKLGLENIDQ